VKNVKCKSSINPNANTGGSVVLGPTTSIAKKEKMVKREVRPCSFSSLFDFNR
jgi:hypothetical protein